MANNANANAGNGHPAGYELFKEISFSGTGNQRNGGLRPEEFIRAVKDRRERNGWDGTRTVKHAIGCLKDSAGDWWHHTVPMTYSTARLREINTSWDEFEKVFCANFFTGSAHILHYDPALLADQRASENAHAYVARLLRGMRLWQNSQQHNPPEDPVPLPIDLEVLLNTPARIEAVKEFIRDVQIPATKNHSSTCIIRTAFKCLAHKGLKHGPAKDAAIKNIEEDDFEKFLNEVYKADYVNGAHRERQQNNGNGNRRRGNTHALDDDVDDEEDDVSALGKKGGKKGKGKKKDGKPKSDGQKNSSAFCLHCGMTNHAADRCFARLRLERKIKESKAGKAAALDDEMAQDLN